jgi:hypothetical protein
VATGAIRCRPTRDFAIFYCLLLFTVCLLNFLRLWPLGAGRENLFLFSHLIVCVFLCWSQIPYSRVLARLAFSVVFLVIIWPLHAADGRARYRVLWTQLAKLGAPVERSDLVIEAFSYQGKIGKIISSDCPKHKTVVVLDGYMATATNYYTKFDSAHRSGTSLLESSCVQLVAYHEAYSQPQETAEILAHNLSGASDAWFLYTHLDTSDVAALHQVVQRFGKITQLQTFENAGYFRLERGVPPT